MDADDLPSLMSGLAIFSGGHVVWSVGPYFDGGKNHSDLDDIKLYHVYDSLSQTPYIDGVGIRAGMSVSTLGEYGGLSAESLSNHSNWNHQNATPFVSL